jgi:Fur family transcriptional regulator, peroxide stress response regulator
VAIIVQIMNKRYTEKTEPDWLTHYPECNKLAIIMQRDPQEFIEEKLHMLEARCRQHGLSMTVQRRAIMENLASRVDHPTADQIYHAIRDRLRGVSRTTVYRVLEAFVRLGVAQKISNPEAKARFDADTARHHHVVCAHCDTVADVCDERLNDLAVPAGTDSGFTILDYSISFVGVCPACRQAAPQNAGHICQERNENG